VHHNLPIANRRGLLMSDHLVSALLSFILLLYSWVLLLVVREDMVVDHNHQFVIVNSIITSLSFCHW